MTLNSLLCSRSLERRTPGRPSGTAGRSPVARADINCQREENTVIARLRGKALRMWQLLMGCLLVIAVAGCGGNVLPEGEGLTWCQFYPAEPTNCRSIPVQISNQAPPDTTTVVQKTIGKDGEIRTETITVKPGERYMTVVQIEKCDTKAGDTQCPEKGCPVCFDPTKFKKGVSLQRDVCTAACNEDARQFGLCRFAKPVALDDKDVRPLNVISQNGCFLKDGGWFPPQSAYLTVQQALSVPGTMSYSADRFKPLNLRIESATGNWHADIKWADNKSGAVGVKAAWSTWTPQDCVTSSSTCTHYVHDLAYALYDFSVDGKKITQASVHVAGPLAVSVDGAGTITQVASPLAPVVMNALVNGKQASFTLSNPVITGAVDYQGGSAQLTLKGSVTLKDAGPLDTDIKLTMTLTSSLRARDADQDGILDRDDNCEYDPNPAQTDSDGNGVGDDCELNEWGFALASDPSAAYYSPESSFARSSSGRPVQIVRHGVGDYVVDFPGLGGSQGGNVQVAAYGRGSERCNIGWWGADSGALHVGVICYGPSGEAHDSPFVVSYRMPGAPTQTSKGAFVWNYLPQGSGDLTGIYQWNSTGATNSVVYDAGGGGYYVRLPGQGGGVGGSIQVTAYGSANSCKVASWYESDGDVYAHVRCFTPAGSLTDSMFTLTFDTRVPMGAHAGGYVWGDQPESASYTPDPSYQRIEKNGLLQSASVKSGRIGQGLYYIHYPGIKPTGSAALVTAYGLGTEYCKIEGWESAGSFNAGTTNVFVRCYELGGTPVNSQFVSAYVTD
jgi:hypothetical protein